MTSAPLLGHALAGRAVERHQVHAAVATPVQPHGVGGMGRGQQRPEQAAPAVIALQPRGQRLWQQGLHQDQALNPVRVAARKLRRHRGAQAVAHQHCALVPFRVQQ